MLVRSVPLWTVMSKPSSTIFPSIKLEPLVNAPRFKKSEADIACVPALPVVSTLSTLMTEFGVVVATPWIECQAPSDAVTGPRVTPAF
jgi:hypothetical protein